MVPRLIDVNPGIFRFFLYDFGIARCDFRNDKFAVILFTVKLLYQ